MFAVYSNGEIVFNMLMPEAGLSMSRQKAYIGIIFYEYQQNLEEK